MTAGAAVQFQRRPRRLGTAGRTAGGAIPDQRYGTRIESDVPTSGADSFNAANTNAIEHAGRVLAMWEGCSAFALDPANLSTLGPVTSLESRCASS